MSLVDSGIVSYIRIRNKDLFALIAGKRQIRLVVFDFLFVVFIILAVVKRNVFGYAYVVEERVTLHGIIYVAQI